MCLFVSHTAIADNVNFGQTLADMYLSNTNADIALVYEDDITNTQDNSNCVVSVYEISGDKIYLKFDELINKNKKNIFISGAIIDIKSTIGNRSENSIEKITINSSPLLSEGVYTIAINNEHGDFFEGEKIIASYTSNNALLYEYITTFLPYDKENENVSKAATSEKNNTSDIISRQSLTLIMALIVLLAALVVYFVVRRKQRKS